VPTLRTETRRRLAGISSADEFETLATAVLRLAEPAYAAIIHTGTNIHGQTVKSPVDGIGSGTRRGTRRLLLVQHTIAARKELRRKWLDPDTGDLTKAVSIFRAEQQRKSARTARVVLTSSQDPDETLVRDVHAAAVPGLTIDIWPGSRIADFLDRHPEGQWLRQQQFGTAATRLSISAAQEISRRSLDAFLPLVPRADVVDRRVHQLLHRFATEARGTGFVIGESGLGKSTSLRRLGDLWIDEGGIALVIDEMLVGDLATLDQVVSAQLRRWEPSLDPDCGKVALGLATPQRPLLLIVEDVNRSTNPRRVVERIVGWSAASTDRKAANWRILCPIWRGNAAVAERSLREQVLSSSILIDRFERFEAIAAIRTRAAASDIAPTALQLNDMAAAFGDDPLLIALNTNWTAPDAQDAIRSYVSDNVEHLADDRLLASDLRHALDHLTERMVEGRKISPDWTSLRQWFRSDPDGLSAIRRLVDHGAVIRLGEDERLAYRHDRVRDHLLAAAIARLIEGERLNATLWGEPFYAELIGVALRGLPPAAIETARVHNGVSLFAALAESTLPEPAQRRFIEAAGEWARFDQSSALDIASQRHHAMHYLARTDGDFVEDLALALPHSFLKLEALARNGHVGAAAAICRTSDPGVRDGWRDRVISHALSRHPELPKLLAALLRKADMKGDDLEGALNLAGEIGDPSLCEPLMERWVCNGPSGISTGWLWAVLRCCPPVGHQLADEVCAVWARLPVKVTRGADKVDSNPRWDIAGYSLPWAFSRKPEAAAVRYLLDLPRKHRGLAQVVSSIVIKIDLPTAVLHSVRASAAVDRRIEGTKSVNFGAHDLARTWSPEHHGRTLSEASRSALAEMWSNRRLNRFDRKAAFSVWSLTPSAEDLDKLADLEVDEVLADQALRARLAAGDKSAVSLLSSRIQNSDHHRWWWQARKVGLGGLHEDVERFFEERRRDSPNGKDLDADHIVAELLMDEGDDFAVDVIVGNWDLIQTSPMYVQAALHLATPITVQLGQAAVRDSGDVSKMLRFIDMHWGIRTTGRPGVSRLAQLQALEPFYQAIRQGEYGDLHIGAFFGAANAIGELAWRKEHLDPLLAQNDRGYCPADEEALFSSLDGEVDIHLTYHRKYFAIDHWFTRREEELWHRGELLGLVGTWARRRGTEHAARLLCEAASLFGERKDLELLESLDPAIRAVCAEAIANCSYDVRRRSLDAAGARVANVGHR
jgi:hypothetical protein